MNYIAEKIKPDTVEQALLKLAKGFHYSETTQELKADGEEKKLVITKKVTKYVPPDFRAITFLFQEDRTKGGAERPQRPLKNVDSEKLREMLEGEWD